VHLAHADLSGLSLFEEAFEWGSRAAGRVLARLGG
jgi:cbb3-type cytochrome oxidase cytochrome c subunit